MDSSDLSDESSKQEDKSSKSKPNIPDTELSDTSNIQPKEKTIDPVNTISSTDNQEPTLLLTLPTGKNVPEQPSTPPGIECISCSEMGADVKCTVCGNSIHKDCSVIKTGDVCSNDCLDAMS
jgi:hypothetical protein